MWQPRIKRSAGTKFMGLVAAIEEDIAAGLISEGERMPPQRGVAAALGIDLTTVTRAYGEARTRGLLTASPGRGGTRVAGHADDLARRAAQSPVDLSLNIPPQPARADLAHRIGRALADALRGGTQAVLQYVPPAGSEADRLAGAAWLADTLGDGIAARLAVTGGAQVALHAVLSTLLRPGDRLAAGAVTYPGARTAAERVGAVPIGLAMDGEGIRPDAFEAACRRAPLPALYLVPTIDNPTTASMGEVRRRAIIAVARRHGVILIEDDPYRRLAGDAPPAIARLAPDITYHIATLAKCATPGLRIAYLVAPSAAHLAEIAEALRASTLMASPLTAAIASRWISDGSLSRIVDAVREESSARQALAARRLGEWSVSAHPAGHHLWLELPADWTAEVFAAAAARSGVAVVPASHFAMGSAAPVAVRVGLGAAADRTALASGLRRLRELLMASPSDSAAVTSDFS